MATAKSKEWKCYIVGKKMVSRIRLAPNTKATSGT